MKHIAVRASSVRRPMPYTTPGLGDRLHTVLLAYNYSITHNVPVTLHLTDDKWNYSRDSRNDMKIRSWNEILGLLPSGLVSVEAHDVLGLENELIWINYLKEKGIDASEYWYSDYPGPRELKKEIDASQYLKQYPCIKPIMNDIELPDKFVTMQFDSNNVPALVDNPSDSRKIPPKTVQKLRDNLKEKGFEIITVGGDAEDERFKILKYAGYAMSKAKYHYGADSGFFHLANFYMKPNQIRILTRGSMSHHLRRALDNHVSVKTV
jgi:hypothetical protein